jgi:hypothetical protein
MPRVSKQDLPYLKRFIDDMIGICCGSDEESGLFKATFDGFGKLKWISSDRASQVILFDLTISIGPMSRNINTKTYQKSQNLHLYIPAASAHPGSCFQGTTMGNVIRYGKQNSSPEDFGMLLKQFVDRLSCRGRVMKNVVGGIDTATKYMDENLRKRAAKMVATKEERTLFLHWQYHPKDITRQTLRRLYGESLAGIDGFEKMTICYSHPKNMREVLTRTSLSEPDEERVSDLIQFLDHSGIREFQNNEHQLKNMSSAHPVPNSPGDWV